MTEITESWYNTLIEDLRDLIVETEFTSRWALIEGYHNLGSRIIQEKDKFEKSGLQNDQIVQRVAESLQRKPRTIYYAIQFAKTYPDLNLLPEGKDCSWHKVVNKYLTDGTEKKTVKKADLYRMIKGFQELIEHERLEAIQTNDDEIFLHGRGAERVTEYIRYLQDQVNKIIGELNESLQ